MPNESTFGRLAQFFDSEIAWLKVPEPPTPPHPQMYKPRGPEGFNPALRQQLCMRLRHQIQYLCKHLCGAIAHDLTWLCAPSFRNWIRSRTTYTAHCYILHKLRHYFSLKIGGTLHFISRKALFYSTFISYPLIHSQNNVISSLKIVWDNLEMMVFQYPGLDFA